LEEPARVARAASALGLSHVVVTSVNRDDLEDEGVSHFVRVIEELRTLPDGLIIEILTPDFKRTQDNAVRVVLEAGPDIFNHNVETVPRLYARVRPQAVYETSVRIFRVIRRHSKSVLTKSGLMLGLGETREEVLEVFRDLRAAGCDMLTLGQYLQSSRLGLPVADYIEPEEFSRYKEEALQMGFKWVESGPFVRSSFHARDSFEALKKHLQRTEIEHARS
jgi:lipoic acid synthetase